ncbi:hypothetical protein ACTXT7_000725 [Hymenolepis weldensis]
MTISLKVISTATLVQAASNGMKLNPSVRDSVGVTNFSKSIKSSVPKVDPVRLVSQPTVPKQHLKQSAPVDDKRKEPEEIGLA